MKAFLDQNKPICTCTEKTCEGCEAGKAIVCHFNAKSLACFLLVAIPSFAIGIIGMCMNHWLFIIPWVAAVLLFFGLVEIRVMCSHCPHYAEPETRTLKCWANYGSPKIWKYRPGPMSILEKIVFFSGIAFVFLYPAAIIAFTGRFILLSIFFAYILAGFYLMHRFMCRKCMNFACPLNATDERAKEEFKKRNPGT